MQRKRASILKVGLVFRSLDDKIEKRVKRDKRVRSLQEISTKPCEEFKTVNSISLTKYCSHRTEIFMKDIVTDSLSQKIKFSHFPERIQKVQNVFSHVVRRDT